MLSASCDVHEAGGYTKRISSLDDEQQNSRTVPFQTENKVGRNARMHDSRPGGPWLRISRKMKYLSILLAHTGTI